MKKALFIIAAASLFIASTAYSQNSSAEMAQRIYESKAERFIKDCHFYRIDTYVEMEEGGLRAWVKVATNLETNQKIGFCYFETENKMTEAALASSAATIVTNSPINFDGSSKPLGYLDVDEIDDLAAALNKIIELTKEHNPNKYSVSYISKSGIDIFYNNEDNKIVYSKVWHATNENGVNYSYRITSPVVSIKAVTKTLKMLEKAKIIINHNINSKEINAAYETEIIGDEEVQQQSNGYNALYIQINPEWQPDVKAIAKKYNKSYEFNPKYDLNEDGILSEEEIDFINYIYSNPGRKEQEEILLEMGHKDYKKAISLIKK